MIIFIDESGTLPDPKDTIVNAADMIAGSALWAYTGKDSSFYEIIKSKIVIEKILHWKEAKRQFLEKIKNLTRTGASAHPKSENFC